MQTQQTKIQTRTHEYSTHLPALILAVQLTDGPVLELGTGVFSTFVLHDMLLPTERFLLSVDDSADWVDDLRHMEGERHAFQHVSHLEKGLFDVIGHEWDVVLIDYSTYKGRLLCLKELLPFSKIVILHDYGDTNSDAMWEQHNVSFEDVSQTVESARYKAFFNAQAPFTVVLSNFVDVKQEIKDSIE